MSKKNRPHQPSQPPAKPPAPPSAQPKAPITPPAPPVPPAPPKPPTPAPKPTGGAPVPLPAGTPADPGAGRGPALRPLQDDVVDVAGAQAKEAAKLAQEAAAAVKEPTGSPSVLPAVPLLPGEVRVVLPEVCWVDDMPFRTHWDVFDCTRAHYPGICVLFKAFYGRKLANGRTVKGTGEALLAFAELVGRELAGAGPESCAVTLPAPLFGALPPVYVQHYKAAWVTPAQRDGMRILYMRVFNRDRSPRASAGGVAAAIKYVLQMIGTQQAAPVEAPAA